MNNQRGSILIFLLFILIVLSILSIGVYGLSYSASRQAEFSRDNSQAYYLAKAGAELIIKNIEEIIEGIESSDEEDFEIEFPNEGKVIITLEYKDNNKEIIVYSTGIVDENKLYESRSSIQAKLKFDSIYGEVSILGVDESGIIYMFNENFENPKKIHIKDSEGNKIRISDPRSFAWDKDDTLVLVSGESGKGKNKDETLIYKLSTNEGMLIKTGGNGFRYVTYSEDVNKFYAIRDNNDKINYLDDYIEWKDIHKPTVGFKIEKLAQGNNAIVGISKGKDSEITYLIDDNGKWRNKIINGDGIEGVYSGITYGKKEDENRGRFIIVGNEKHNIYPIFIFSENGYDWQKGIQKNTMSGINYELNDVTWTGKIFVAIGNSGTIYTSTNGKDWYVFDRQDIIKDEGSSSTHWFNYSKVSGYGDYIVAYSNTQGGRLVSTDGGATWIEKGPIKYGNNEIKLIDLIVINKGQGEPDFSNPTIHWSKKSGR
ncbi:hypothetical protein [Clostridium sp. Cult1]|uniref:hypothetical protein n=1 Tax=Clostridium sp. Cult1 TaxID=2079002 RepID=UPI001F284B41|nr:hypothetical protein [Clostridium sp. Cult1]MCF6464226.1 hypothetical protein [Clostridium sp. Cult1]